MSWTLFSDKQQQESNRQKSKCCFSKGDRENQKLESLPSKQFYPILLNAKSPLKQLLFFPFQFPFSISELKSS